jgi:pimeloyl-ACP methyl ester carboxylesterase
MLNTGMAAALAAVVAFVQPTPTAPERKTCKAADGVPIVYTAAGSGEPALVFIHGGFANRGFWDEQIKAFSPRHRVAALDLPGHGESGADRKKWGMPEFGDDVRAVVQAEGLEKVVLFGNSLGNSLGGPVAVEAALRLPGRVLGVVGIDTFQMLGGQPVEQARKQAEAFRSDYAGNIKVMVKRLFHPDAPPALMADAAQRMLHTPPEVAYQMLLSLGGYDEPAAVGRLTVPLLAINGDLYGTDLTNVRNVKPDFEVIVMEHMGHYPMLERPQQFDGHVSEVVTALVRHAAEGKPLQLAGALAPPKARKEVRLTPAQLDRCTGRYEIAPGFVLTITREGDRLMSQATGQPQVEIFAESESEFFPKVFDAQLSFELKDPGPAKNVILHQAGRDVSARRLE